MSVNPTSSTFNSNNYSNQNLKKTNHSKPTLSFFDKVDQNISKPIKDKKIAELKKQDDNMHEDTLNLKRQRLSENSGVVESIKKGKFSEDDVKDKIYTWPEGYPLIIFKYEGESNNGKRDGEGVLSSLEGHRYEGQFKDDKITGKGTYTWPSKNVYHGDFVDGKRHGKGIIKLPNGASYEGDFANDKMTGKGISKDVNGNSIEGSFYDGKPFGKVKVKPAYGEPYEGEFVQMANGQQRLI